MSRVFVHALRQAVRTLLPLALGSGLFSYLVVFSSSSFIAETPDVPFFRDPPRALEAFLGGRADFLRPSGWVALGMAHPVTLALLVAAALLVASGSVATEVERGSIDLVLGRPVGRVRFLLGKAAASGVAVTVVEAGGLAGVLLARATVERAGEIPLGNTFRAFAGSWVLFLALSMVGLLVSARTSLRSRALGVAAGLIVAWFFANFIALLIDGVSWLRFASPFHYFRAGDVLSGEPMAAGAAGLAALAVLALAGALWSFARRDLTR